MTGQWRSYNSHTALQSSPVLMQLETWGSDFLSQKMMGTAGHKTLPVSLADVPLLTSLVKRFGHHVVGMSSCKPASSTRSGLLM